MKKKKLKPYVIPTIMGIFLIMISNAFIISNQKGKNKELDYELNYVSNTILDNPLAVINENPIIIPPYIDPSVQLSKEYYDYKGTKKSQENAILYHDNTYIQNTGVDYIKKEPFEVVSILKGEVINVKNDELLGQIIEIKHDNNTISIYQSLGKTNVKQGDKIGQGQIIGISGTNSLNKELGNHIHFELYIDGHIVNPIKFINQKQKNKE